MPATVHYNESAFDRRSGRSKAIDASGSVSDDGLITGAATYVYSELSEPPFVVGQQMPPEDFKLNRNASVFVQSCNLEKQNGITYARVSVVGVVSPPAILKSTEVGPRSFSKTQSVLVTIGSGPNAETEEQQKSFSFDYLAETCAASAYVGSDFDLENLQTDEPRLLDTWNQAGAGSIVRQSEPGDSAPQDLDGIVARPRILTSETRQEIVVGGGILRITKTRQIVYE
jgi:hypothetical protein